MDAGSRIYGGLTFALLVGLVVLPWVVFGFRPTLIEIETSRFAGEAIMRKEFELEVPMRKMMQKACFNGRQRQATRSNNFELHNPSKSSNTTVEESARRVPTGPDPLHHHNKPSKPSS